MNDNQPVTKKELVETLGTFTEETLLPAVSVLMDKKFSDFSDKIDEKLADLKGDLTILMRKEDRKLGALVTKLQEKQVLSEEEAIQILSLEPFPKP